MKISNVKKLEAATATAIGFTKILFIGGIISGVVGVVIASFIPNTPKPRYPRGGRGCL